MNAFRLEAGFTLVKAAPAVILPRMTAGSGTGQAQTSAKYLLLLVVVVLAPVIFTWLTSAPDRGDTDFDQLLEAGKTHYETGQAQQAIDAFARALKAKRTETDLLLNLANAHRLANQPAEVIKYAREAWLSTSTSAPGIFWLAARTCDSTNPPKPSTRCSRPTTSTSP